MKQNVLADLSGELQGLVEKVAPYLVHIGAEDIPYRTGVVWNPHFILTTALAAREGEPVAALGPEGKTIQAEVRGFDARSGLALLKTETDLGDPGWEGERPRVGALGAAIAHPSPAGTEAALAMARCVGEDYFQTDADRFPGFSGAAVVSASGKLWGMVTVNAAGNRGLAVPFEQMQKIVDDLEKSGSRRRRVLGVRTQPVEGGLLVTDVAQGSAARESGLLVGDVLGRIGTTDLKHPFDLLEALEKSEGKIEVWLTRGGREMTVEIEPRLEAETTARHWRHGFGHGR